MYESYNQIRKKIRANLTKTGMTRAAFAREISKMFTRKKNISGLAAFKAKSTPVPRNTRTTFSGSHLFFEKLRIEEGKPGSSEWRMRGMDASPMATRSLVWIRRDFLTDKTSSFLLVVSWTSLESLFLACKSRFPEFRP